MIKDGLKDHRREQLDKMNEIRVSRLQLTLDTHREELRETSTRGL